MPAPILPLIEAVPHWPERGALVGLDLGTKTIGVAVSDPDRRLATGVETVKRKAFKADAARLLRSRPSAMPSASCSACRSTWMAAKARARNRPGPLPATSPASPRWRSRCGTSGSSTAAVERELIGMDVGRARRAEVIDEHAAIFILQGALDRLAKLRGER